MVPLDLEVLFLIFCFITSTIMIVHTECIHTLSNAKPYPKPNIKPRSIFKPGQDLTLILNLTTISSSLSNSDDQASRLANLSIVLRLVKRTLQPYVKIRSSVQRDLLSFKPSTVRAVMRNNRLVERCTCLDALQQTFRSCDVRERHE